VPLPASVHPDVRLVIGTRAVRGLADGFVSVVLAAYLDVLGLTPLEVGAILTATLLGSAALTLGVGLRGASLPVRGLLLAACALMAATGLGFALASSFGALLAVAFVGTLNTGAGDVTVFLPTEQALLASRVEAADRPALFARYNLAGTLAAALGALASGLPAFAALRLGAPLESALRLSFVAYAALAIVLALGYRRMQASPQVARPSGAALEVSRPVVLRLAALFSIDSFGSGFAVQSLVALWLLRRFELSLELTGAVFFAAGVLSAFGQLLSAPLARRIGLVRTMVYTHVPANLLLALAPFMPSAGLAVACLLARMAFAQMDVPARQSLVMSVVPAEERAAAASVTNVPRSLAAALAPLPAGWLLGLSPFGWPLVVAGGLKIAYDLLLLARFRGLEPRA
jgi:MFS family permease